MLNQMPDQVLNQVQDDVVRHDEMLKQVQHDVVQHDGIQHDLITERGWDYEILKQVQDD